MMPCGGLYHGQLELNPWTFPEPWRVVHLSVRDRSLTSPALQDPTGGPQHGGAQHIAGQVCSGPGSTQSQDQEGGKG